MHIAIFLLLHWMPSASHPAKESPIEAKLERVTRIWNKDPHSAFTDLIWWKDRFICVFRTGSKHVSDDGAIQLLSSEDGQQWTPMARLTSATDDLRDPKLAIGRDKTLFVYAAGALHDKQQQTHRTLMWNSWDGKTWSKPSEVGEPDSWLWRVTRHDTHYYGCHVLEIQSKWRNSKRSCVFNDYYSVPLF